MEDQDLGKKHRLPSQTSMTGRADSKRTSVLYKKKASNYTYLTDARFFSDFKDLIPPP